MQRRTVAALNRHEHRAPSQIQAVGRSFRRAFPQRARQPFGAQHRNQRQGDQQRSQQREGHCKGKFLEHDAHHALHENEREEHA